MNLQGIEALFTVTKADLEAEIQRRRELAAPLRAEREKLSLEIIARKQRQAELNKSIDEIERPLRMLKRLLGAKLHELGKLMPMSRK